MSPMGNGSATDSTAIAPDGSPVALYSMLPPGGEPEIITAAVPACAPILELGCGAGRVTHPLVAAGHPVVAVDQSPEMLDHVRGARTVHADIETLALATRFPAVLLGSCLVNTAVPDQAEAFLATCLRHVDRDGVVLVQRTSPEWAESLRPGHRLRIGSFDVVMTRVSVECGVMRATQECTDGTHTWTHSWTDLVYTDTEFSALVAANGFTPPVWLAEEWALLRPLGR
jgi:SAM-dependent methyltransferase